MDSSTTAGKELRQRKQSKPTDDSSAAVAAAGGTEGDDDMPKALKDLTPENQKKYLEELRVLGWPGKVDDGLGRWWWVYDDCCGLVCMMITIGLHIFAYWAQVTFIFRPWLGMWGAPHLVYTVLAVLAVYSHTKCQFTAPGVVPKDLKAPVVPDEIFADDKERNHYEMRAASFIDRRTKTIKPPHSHRCSEIGAVVLKMDHYCPWVNNIVAIYTQKYFLLFIFYTCLTCIFCAITLGGRFMACYQTQQNRYDWSNRNRGQVEPYCRPDTTDTVVCICNAVEALIFGIFTIAMGCDQAEAIMENTNYIDRLQQKRGKEQSLLQNLTDVFGEPPNWRWLLPLPPTKQLRDDFQNQLRVTWFRLALIQDCGPTHEIAAA